MKRLRLLLVLVGCALGGLHAAELSPGLAYLRPGAPVTAERGSVVVDLRYVADEAAAAPVLAALEPGTANPRRIILALISPETPAGLHRRLAALPRCLTLGHAAPGFKTDIVVIASADSDRRAFDALVAGSPPEKLISENGDKLRYDEAALIHEHATGLEVPRADVEPDVIDAPPAQKALIDAVLQRAVQIHRGLVAMKKL